MPLLSKILNKIEGKMIKTLAYINVKQYMKLYVKYLQKKGIIIPDYDGRSYIHPSVDFDGSRYSFIKIGQAVTISKDVLILVHDYSIGRGIASVVKENDSQKRYRFMKEVCIDDGAFIGARCVLLPGARVGKNSIVGACSLVHGTIEDNTIASGIPAKSTKSVEDWGRMHIERNDFETYISK